MKNFIIDFLMIIAVICVLVLVFFRPAKAYAQTIDMSFGQVLDSGKRDIYRMKIQVSEDITYKWLTVTPYGGWDTWSEWSNTSIKGLPFRDTYNIGIKTTLFDSWYIDVNHYCSHDVISNNGHEAYAVKTLNDCTAYDNNKWLPKNKWDNQLTVITFGYHKKFSSWNLN